jgi:hypothetical protein
LLGKVTDGLVPALIRHLDGHLTLHAGAAARHGRSLVLVGNHAAGKSTAVAELCRRPGFELVADDTATFGNDPDEEPYLLPTERQHWLLPQSCSALGLEGGSTLRKRAIPSPQRAAERSAAAAICILDFDEAAAGPRVTRLRGVAAFGALVPWVIRLAVDDEEMHRREAVMLERIVTRVPIYELRRPRDLRQLRECGDLLESLLGT